MLKIMKEKWDKNKFRLEEKIATITQKQLYDMEYIDIVEMTFETIYNEGEEKPLDVEGITEIDNGNYQGTLLYLIPFDTYQPSEDNYLMTAVNYGSCSGCDTLQNLQFHGSWSDEKGELVKKTQPEKVQTGLLALCMHLIVNTIKPYNSGWEHDEKFDEVVMKKTE